MTRILLPLAIAIAIVAAPDAWAEDQTQTAPMTTATDATSAAQTPNEAALPSPATPQEVAETTTQPPSAVQAVPDASFRAMWYRVVRLILEGDKKITGRLVAIEDQTVTLVVPPTNTVTTVRKKEVVELQAVKPVPQPKPAQADIVDNRHFAISLGAAPAITLDLDAGYFYSIASFSILFPAVTAGEFAAMSFGLGLNIFPAANTRWKLEIFPYYMPTRMGDWFHALGLGLGAHVTAANGLTFGFRVPILGYCFGGFPTDWSFIMYYIASTMGLPLMSLGYRF